MSTDVHAHAQQLIAQEHVEGLQASESAWLAAHLQECGECSGLAQETSAALRALRTTAVTLPPGLAERTQFRVGLRAQQLREHEPRRHALWIAAGISWVAGVASAPYVWRFFAWLGQETGAPKLVWEAGFAFWWAVPALFAAIVLLVEHERQTGESYWFQRGQ